MKWPWVLKTLWISGPLIILGVRDMFQKKHAILRNFPVIGHGRYLMEKIRPEINQYFIESNTDGRPFSREERSLVYQRSKNALETLPFGTQHDVYQEGYEYFKHSLDPTHVDPSSLRVTIGGPQCTQPYSASIFNIGAMSYGSLSKNAIEALNRGTAKGDFAHNTGEGGISPYHLKGGDLIYQVGTGYFGCRDPETGGFHEERFVKTVEPASVKMIELKLSQGAKPGHGGILPAGKNNPEIASIRGVEPYTDVNSPPSHKAFNSPKGLIEFIDRLRALAGGRPVGFKLCVGQEHEFIAICKAMIELELYPDFISVDGGEGGTGAAPLEFSNNLGSPMKNGLSFVHQTLRGFGLRKHIKLIASGRIINAFDILRASALGADITYSSRGMMFALGCIQARECHSNKCPTGVASHKQHLMVGLDPTYKSERVSNFHRKTIEAAAELLGAMGLNHLDDLRPAHLQKRLSPWETKNYAELYPMCPEGALLHKDVPDNYRHWMSIAHSGSFGSTSLKVLSEQHT